MAYLKRITTRRPPQSAPIPGSTQVPNSARGFTWQVDDWTRLRRFLVLGSEGGSYYASEQALTLANADAVARCIAADGVRAVSTIVEVSERGAAPKNDPALFALAMAAGLGDIETRRSRASSRQAPGCCWRSTCRARCSRATWPASRA